VRFQDIKLKEQFASMGVARRDQIDGSDVYVVRASTADNKREQLSSTRRPDCSFA